MKSRARLLFLAFMCVLFAAPSFSFAASEAANAMCPKADPNSSPKTVYDSGKSQYPAIIKTEVINGQVVYTKNLWRKECRDNFVKAFCTTANFCDGEQSGSECYSDGAWKKCDTPDTAVKPTTGANELKDGKVPTFTTQDIKNALEGKTPTDVSKTNPSTQNPELSRLLFDSTYLSQDKDTISTQAKSSEEVAKLIENVGAEPGLFQLAKEKVSNWFSPSPTGQVSEFQAGGTIDGIPANPVQTTSGETLTSSDTFGRGDTNSQQNADSQNAPKGWYDSYFDAFKTAGPQPANQGSPYLANQRANLMAELDTNPRLRDTVAAVIAKEMGGGGAGSQAVLESMVNRAALRGYTSLDQAIRDGFYGPVNRGTVDAYVNSGVSAADRAVADVAIDAVRGGSNICNLCTDQGMVNEIKGAKWNIGGEYFGHMAGSSRWADQQAQLQARYDAAASPWNAPAAPYYYDATTQVAMNTNLGGTQTGATSNPFDYSGTFAQAAPYVELAQNYPDVSAIDISSALQEVVAPTQPLVVNTDAPSFADVPLPQPRPLTPVDLDDYSPPLVDRSANPIGSFEPKPSFIAGAWDSIKSTVGGWFGESTPPTTNTMAIETSGASEPIQGEPSVDFVSQLPPVDSVSPAEIQANLEAEAERLQVEENVRAEFEFNRQDDTAQIKADQEAQRLDRIAQAERDFPPPPPPRTLGETLKQAWNDYISGGQPSTAPPSSVGQNFDDLATVPDAPPSSVGQNFDDFSRSPTAADVGPALDGDAFAAAWEGSFAISAQQNEDLRLSYEGTFAFNEMDTEVWQRQSAFENETARFAGVDFSDIADSPKFSEIFTDTQTTDADVKALIDASSAESADSAQIREPVIVKVGQDQVTLNPDGSATVKVGTANGNAFEKDFSAAQMKDLTFKQAVDSVNKEVAALPKAQDRVPSGGQTVVANGPITRSIAEATAGIVEPTPTSVGQNFDDFSRSPTAADVGPALDGDAFAAAWEGSFAISAQQNEDLRLSYEGTFAFNEMDTEVWQRQSAFENETARFAGVDFSDIADSPKFSDIFTDTQYSEEDTRALVNAYATDIPDDSFETSESVQQLVDASTLPTDDTRPTAQGENGTLTTCASESCVGGELGDGRSQPLSEEQLALKDEITKAEQKRDSLQKQLDAIKNPNTKALVDKVNAGLVSLAKNSEPTESDERLRRNGKAALIELEKIAREAGNDALADKLANVRDDLNSLGKKFANAAAVVKKEYGGSFMSAYLQREPKLMSAIDARDGIVTDGGMLIKRVNPNVLSQAWGSAARSEINNNVAQLNAQIDAQTQEFYATQPTDIARSVEQSTQTAQLPSTLTQNWATSYVAPGENLANFGYDEPWTAPSVPYGPPTDALIVQNDISQPQDAIPSVVQGTPSLAENLGRPIDIPPVIDTVPTVVQGVTPTDTGGHLSAEAELARINDALSRSSAQSVSTQEFNELIGRRDELQATIDLQAPKEPQIPTIPSIDPYEYPQLSPTAPSPTAYEKYVVPSARAVYDWSYNAWSGITSVFQSSPALPNIDEYEYPQVTQSPTSPIADIDQYEYPQVTPSIPDINQYEYPQVTPSQPLPDINQYEYPQVVSSQSLPNIDEYEYPQTNGPAISPNGSGENKVVEPTTYQKYFVPLAEGVYDRITGAGKSIWSGITSVFTPSPKLPDIDPYEYPQVTPTKEPVIPDIDQYEYPQVTQGPTSPIADIDQYEYPQTSGPIKDVPAPAGSPDVTEPVVKPTVDVPPKPTDTPDTTVKKEPPVTPPVPPVVPPMRPPTIPPPMPGPNTGRVFDRDYYCIKSITPVYVTTIPAGTPFPSDCYNSGAGVANSGGVNGAFGQLIGRLLGATGLGPNANSPQTVPSTPPPASNPTTGVAQSLPRVSIIANPSTVAQGGKARLSWSSALARECTVFGAGNTIVGRGLPDGSNSTPALATSTLFTISCTGSSGTATAETTVLVE